MVFSLYYVLEAFVRPLLWAVLVGLMLHPIQRGCCGSCRIWLTNMLNQRRCLVSLCVCVRVCVDGWVGRCESLSELVIFFSTPPPPLETKVVGMVLLPINFADALCDAVIQRYRSLCLVLFLMLLATAVEIIGSDILEIIVLVWDR